MILQLGRDTITVLYRRTLKVGMLKMVPVRGPAYDLLALEV